jgi:hypothetical protein
MTEVGEGVAVLIQTMEQPQKCEYEPPDTTWKSKLDGQSESLAKNLTDHCGIEKPSVPASVKDISYTCWPSQAHHLIPWQQLQKHAVTQWVAESPPVVAGKVLKDNGYSVDHGNNGKFMPYASSLTEWEMANADEKKKLAEKVMAAAGMQLHQGPHSFSSYGVGEDGYKTRVKEYLDRININELGHVPLTKCPDCTPKCQNGKVPPRRNVLQFLDTASARLEVDINTGRVFVSRRAAGFAIAGGVMG